MGKFVQAEVPASFGARLAEFRKAAGFTQVELAGELGISQRLLAIEKLDVTEKRQLLQLLDAFIERGQWKRRAQAGGAR